MGGEERVLGKEGELRRSRRSMEGREKLYPPLLCLGDNLLPPGVHLRDPPLQARWRRTAGNTCHPASCSRQLLPLKCLQKKTT